MNKRVFITARSLSDLKCTGCVRYTLAEFYNLSTVSTVFEHINVIFRSVWRTLTFELCCFWCNTFYQLIGVYGDAKISLLNCFTR